MTASVFERLLYTDCSVGKGYDGNSGYQVQAQSSGVDRELRDASMSVQYRVPARWVTDGQAVEDFPRSLMHGVAGGVYATSRGRYLGAEVSGSRQTGNFLTDCLLARGADAYGAVRPAQLWRAGFWRDSAWPDTHCPQFADIDEGALDREAVVEWLRKDKRRGPVLAQFVSVLEGATPRVLIRADTPEQALVWIAAATLLLPTARALAISFCVFDDRTNDARFAVSAVPADLHPDVLPGRQGNKFVIDATTEAAGDAPVSDRARFWVDKLWRCEEPYDVVEAVELAARWSGTGSNGSADEGSDARVTAWAVCAADSPTEDVAALGRWLLQADVAAVREHGDAVSQRLLQPADPSADALRVLDALAAARRVNVDPVAMRIRLLETEMRLAAAGTASPAEPLAAVLLLQREVRGVTERFVAALLEAQDPEVDLLLRVSARHGVWRSVDDAATPVRPAFESRLLDFVRSWVAAPRTAYDVTAWGEAGASVLAVLTDVLVDLHASRDVRLRASLPRFSGDLVGRVGHLGTEFAADVEGAYVSTLGTAKRQDRIAQIAQGMASDSAAAALARQAALASWSVLDDAAALDLVSRLPATTPIHPVILDAVVRALVLRSRAADLPALVAMLRLESRPDTRGFLDRSKELRKALAAVRFVRGLGRAASAVARGGDINQLSDQMRSARGLDGAVTQLAGYHLVAVDLGAPVSWLGGVLLRDLPDKVATEFVAEWERRLGGPAGRVAAAHGKEWLTDEAIPRARRRYISEVLSSRGAREPTAGTARRDLGVRGSRHEGDA